MASKMFMLLEVMDKQLPVAAAFSWAAVGGVVGYFGGRRFGWRAALPVVLAILVLALYLLAQFTDRFVGPATIAETGWWYPAFAGLLVVTGIAASFWGAAQHRRRTSNQRAGADGGAV
jgi:Co/Zn/Cd efflux system component